MSHAFFIKEHRRFLVIGFNAPDVERFFGCQVFNQGNHRILEQCSSCLWSFGCLSRKTLQLLFIYVVCCISFLSIWFLFFLRNVTLCDFQPQRGSRARNNRCLVNSLCFFKKRKQNQGIKHLSPQLSEAIFHICPEKQKNNKIFIYLVDVLGTFRPHVADVGVLGTVEQPLKILKQCVLVLIQESTDIVDNITGVVPS